MTIKDLKKLSPLSGEKFDFVAGESLKFSAEKLFLLLPTLTLTQKQINLIKKNEALVAKGIPPQYIFKKAYFCQKEFYIDKSVLIPRPETEILVAEAIKFLEYRTKNKEFRGKPIRILDLGTGSGCIMISIAKILNSKFSVINTTSLASDISPAALRIARKNSKAHRVKIILSKVISLKKS